jgi:hypothetical protein
VNLRGFTSKQVTNGTLCGGFDHSVPLLVSSNIHAYLQPTTDGKWLFRINFTGDNPASVSFQSFPTTIGHVFEHDFSTGPLLDLKIIVNPGSKQYRRIISPASITSTNYPTGCEPRCRRPC